MMPSTACSMRKGTARRRRTTSVRENAASVAPVERSALLPNPTLDASMNTIPLGVTNPPGLDKLSQVPNYAFGISELIEIGKRGPRQRAATASLEATVDDAREALRGQWFALLAQIGAVASAQVRVAAMEDLAQDAERLATAEEQRAGQGDVPRLDAERARLDAARLRSTLAQERQALATALLECSRTAGVPCDRFASAAQAQRFLESHLAIGPASAPPPGVPRPARPPTGPPPSPGVSPPGRCPGGRGTVCRGKPASRLCRSCGSPCRGGAGSSGVVARRL